MKRERYRLVCFSNLLDAETVLMPCVTVIQRNRIMMYSSRQMLAGVTIVAAEVLSVHLQPHLFCAFKIKKLEAIGTDAVAKEVA